MPASFTLPLLRRRGQWIAPLPPCAWDLGFTKLDSYDESLMREQLDAKRREEVGSYGYVRTRDVVLRGEHWYYRASALSALAPYLAAPPIAKALVRFLHHLEARRIVPKAVRADRVVPPPAQREHNGRRYRGPVWTEQEDYVVRKWFSRHTVGVHAGKHAKLTEAQWNTVLEELGGNRRKSDVKSRITELNRKLRLSLLVDGWLTREAVVRYKREALGENEVRVPRNRPRMGYHHGYN